MRGLRWVVMSAVLVAGAAAAQPAERQQQQGQQGTQQPRGQQGMQQPGQMQAEGQLDIQNWLNELTLVNTWAIELSQVVQERAATAQVKQFAGSVAQDQQQLRQKLQQLGQIANVNLQEQGAVQGLESMKEQFMHSALLTSLVGIPSLNGVNVDRAYLASMVLAHDLAINKIQWAAKQIQDPKLTQAVNDVQRTLMQNRQQAYRLLGRVAPQVQRGQARQAPPARP